MLKYMKYSSILEAIFKNANDRPEKLALCDSKRCMSYAELWSSILYCADCVTSIGIRDKDSVVIIAKPVLEYMVLFHAIQLVGAIPIPVEKNCSETRLLNLFTETGAKILFSPEGYGPECYVCQKYPVLGEKTNSSVTSFPSCDAVSMILFTTGTTGNSKGIVMTHGADIAIAENILHAVNMKNDNIELVPMPFNHSFADRKSVV